MHFYLVVSIQFASFVAVNQLKIYYLTIKTFLPIAQHYSKSEK